MRVVKSENISYFDVDQTLIMWDAHGLEEADFYGVMKNFDPHEKHIEFLKSLKQRGSYIIVHSGNGWLWAKNVVEALQLTEFVDEVKSKPTRIIDDKDYSNWLPTRIYLED